MRSDFWWALAGGLMIGGAAATLLFTHGRIAGISGIAGSLVSNPRRLKSWRAAFLAGLVASGFFWLVAEAESLPGVAPVNLYLMTLAGLLVGWGTKAGRGCTSGHGVCGIGRLSKRSMVATAAFMATGMVTVYLVRHVFS